MNPLRELLLDENNFRRRLSHRLPQLEHNTVYEYDEQKLRLSILHLNGEDWGTQANGALQRAVEKRDQLDTRRKNRRLIFRGAHKGQTLATSIVNFLDSFSTIIDIVRSIDQRAGGLAYGTLYILLKVCFVSKSGIQLLV
jgi:hypothetical protein